MMPTKYLLEMILIAIGSLLAGMNIGFSICKYIDDKYNNKIYKTGKKIKLNKEEDKIGN